MTNARYALPLADGGVIGLRAGDRRSSGFLDRFARAAGLPRPAEGRRAARTVAVKIVEGDGGFEGGRTCRLPLIDDPAGFYCQAVELSMAVGRLIQRRGGVLLHGALAECRGRGIVLAAPGGTGKSTASARLPAPWRSLCDDTTLVMPDRAGAIWAQPWPTWSRFIGDGPGGAWTTPEAVRLAAFFFLRRASRERVDAVGPGEGLTLLVESCEQASHSMARWLESGQARAVRRERFDNLTAIIRTVPVHFLHLSRGGAFWEEIERALDQPKVKRFRPPSLLS